MDAALSFIGSLLVICDVLLLLDKLVIRVHDGVGLALGFGDCENLTKVITQHTVTDIFVVVLDMCSLLSLLPSLRAVNRTPVRA